MLRPLQLCLFFFFKQKTAYEMRISDWSSDVCSSDLTTIYGLNDRYRGVTGRRDVIFANAEDLKDLGLKHGDLVDVHAGPARSLTGYTVIAHAISRGSLAAYYPEANCLIPLDDHDRESGTPSYKSVRVTIGRSGSAISAVTRL